MKIIDRHGIVYEYDDSKVKHCKPGVAYGAEDIQSWANRRATGKAGAYSRKEAKRERKRALELSKMAKKPIRAFDGTLQIARLPKKRKKAKGPTPYKLWKKARRKVLGLKV